MEANKGRNFLKVTGILMIIGGAISIILGIVMLVSGLAIASITTTTPDAETVIAGAAIGGVFIVSAIIMLVSGILELIAGIVGVKNNNRPEKATACIVWGFIVLALQLISLILSFAGGSTSAGAIILTIIFGIAIPVLYLIGAFMNKKAA